MTDAPGVVNTIENAIFFSSVIQGRDITVVLPPTVEPALQGLPPAGSAFTGRDDDVEELLRGLAPGGRGRAAVAGLAGVGKTELTVQTAHRALAEDLFPGGVLFIDMFGYDPQRRRTAGDALSHLLGALGMPGEHIPADDEDRSRLFRSVLAAFGAQRRRILLIIDNAATEEQVRPLLPGDGATATLVTSRHTLNLDARLHDLDVLDTDTSVLLLAGVLRTRRPDDPRASAALDREHGCRTDAEAIAERCGGLPLALQIAAALLAELPSRPLSSLADALRDAHTRLDRLTRAESVRAVFDLSYRHLSDEQARMLRLLSVNPGPDVSTDAAACLADIDRYRAETLLQDLARAHLVDAGQVWGRWRLHDLVRLHAEGQPDAEATVDGARNRLFTHYVMTTHLAVGHLQPPSVVAAHRSPPPAGTVDRIETAYAARGQMQPLPVTVRFRTRTDALAWLETERANLVAACTGAATAGHALSGVALAAGLQSFLIFRRHLADLLTVTTAARTLCQQVGDRHGEGMALSHLGVALNEARRSEEAVVAHTQAVDLIRATGNEHDEGIALNNLGLALRGAGRPDEAITAHERAIEIYRRAGDRHDEGIARSNLGLALVLAGRADEAVTAHTRAVDLFVETDDQHGEGQALDNLGAALSAAGRTEEAIAAHTRAVDLLRRADDRHTEGRALYHLGVALRATGRTDEAVTAHTRAVDIFSKDDDPRDEGRALTELGAALRVAGRADEAVAAHTRAVAAYRRAGERGLAGRATYNLGVALHAAQRFAEAIDAHTRAAEIHHETGDRHREGKALVNLSVTLIEVGRFEEARRRCGQALEAFGADAPTARQLLADPPPWGIRFPPVPPEMRELVSFVLLCLDADRMMADGAGE
ncbi:tetratricopeptide repeat protein [Micromonospora sp. R77]|uniref:tetratricopeptide repeat protein n=1 Tax=Micromonospora sp. R77 TaxID=2925836 RepID=UPI001F610A4E|nr:tetratricopeptide repeat protein [Micromonospora sp. R77]MCI4065858.1 tetratricopeptide repeat protein [Micromonospora sp. R77]